MFWSLQQPVDESDGSSSPADFSACTSTPDASPAPSISEDESSSLSGEVSNSSIDDAASDTTVSSQLENEVFSLPE